MKIARIEHKGHEIKAELDGDAVTIRVDGEACGRGRWKGKTIHERPALLSFLPDPNASKAEPEVAHRQAHTENAEILKALRSDESDEIYARLETRLAAREELV